VNGVTYICDLCVGDVGTCTPSGTDVCPGHCVGGSNPGAVCEEQADCLGSGDQYCNFNGDGNPTICYGSAADTILDFVPVQNRVWCLGGGNDVAALAVYSTLNYKVNLGPGDDRASGDSITVIEGGTGADYIAALAGDDTIYGNAAGVYTGDSDNDLYGGSGNDAIVGANGDDLIFGGDGADSLYGQGGRDVLKGENGNDSIVSNFGGPTGDDVLGSLLCGQAGDDELLALGPGHQCLDPGPDQTVSQSDPDDCIYGNSPDNADAHDVATVTNCAHAVKVSTNGTILSRTPGCGCD
jgi:Ca2+-binding RTX toxin-like protein